MVGERGGCQIGWREKWKGLGVGWGKRGREENCGGCQGKERQAGRLVEGKCVKR